MNDITTGTVRVPYRYTPGALPKKCFWNVFDHIKCHGGRTVFGWIVGDVGPVYTLIHHAVWESPDGELVCITPRIDPTDIHEDIVFAPDPDATLVERDGELDSRPERNLPKSKHPAVIRVAELFDVADEHWRAGRLDKYDYWTHKAVDLWNKSKVTT